MPEGDTVWLTAQRLHRALSGQALVSTELRVPALTTTDLTGMSVIEVVARGKHLLMRLDTALTLHSHLRMDGSWYVSPAGRAAARYPAHMIRALLGTTRWLTTGYRIHDLKIVATRDEDTLVGHLGPDLLGADWHPGQAVGRLHSVPERAIGEALLDQRNLAGVGNLYKSETLFIQHINPWRPAGDISDLDALVATAHRLMRANRDHPEQSTTGLLGRGQEHWVYERAGQPCRRCRTPIRRELQGDPPMQRSTFWCERCQPT